MELRITVAFVAVSPQKIKAAIVGSGKAVSVGKAMGWQIVGDDMAFATAT